MSSQLLKAAVNDCRVLAFEYDGKARIVEPHAFGRNRKGDLVLRAFQVAGESASGSNWKLFTVSKITLLTVVEEAVSHAPRPGYKPGDTAMTLIEAELPAPLAEAA